VSGLIPLGFRAVISMIRRHFPGALSALSACNFSLIMSSVISSVLKVSVSGPVKTGVAVGIFRQN